MKKNTKKLICMISATTAMYSTVAGIAMFNNVEASAANATSFEMVGGSIRYDEPTGLRFAAQLDVASYEAGETANATYGMLIFPVNVMEKHGIDYTTYDAETNYIAEIETKAADYLEYMKNQDKTVVYTVSSQPVAVSDNETVAYYEIYGSLGDVLYNNLSRDFFAVAYQKIGDDYTYASFENGTNVRSVAYVAGAAWADASSTQQTTLNGFLSKAIYHAQGKTQAEAETEVSNGNKPVWTATISKAETTVEIGKKQQLTISAEGIKLGAKWASSDSNVVSVDKYGVLTAKKIGNATITANCAGQTLTCEVTTQWPLVNELEGLDNVTLEHPNSTDWLVYNDGQFAGVYMANTDVITVSTDVRADSTSTQSIRIAGKGYGTFYSAALNPVQWAEVQKGGKCYVWIKIEGTEGSTISFTMSGTGGITSVQANTWTKVEVPETVLNNTKTVDGVAYQRFYFYIENSTAVFYFDDIIVEKAQ